MLAETLAVARVGEGRSASRPEAGGRRRAWFIPRPLSRGRNFAVKRRGCDCVRVASAGSARKTFRTRSPVAHASASVGRQGKSRTTDSLPRPTAAASMFRASARTGAYTLIRTPAGPSRISGSTPRARLGQRSQRSSARSSDASSLVAVAIGRSAQLPVSRLGSRRSDARWSRAAEDREAERPDPRGRRSAVRAH